MSVVSNIPKQHFSRKNSTSKNFSIVCINSNMNWESILTVVKLEVWKLLTFQLKFDGN